MAKVIEFDIPAIDYLRKYIAESVDLMTSEELKKKLIEAGYHGKRVDAFLEALDIGKDGKDTSI